MVRYSKCKTSSLNGFFVVSSHIRAADSFRIYLKFNSELNVVSVQLGLYKSKKKLKTKLPRSLFDMAKVVIPLLSLLKKI